MLAAAVELSGLDAGLDALETDVALADTEADGGATAIAAASAVTCWSTSSRSGASIALSSGRAPRASV